MAPRSRKPTSVFLRMEGFEMVEKLAMPSGTTARVLVPRSWVGKRVRVVRVDP